MQKLLEQANVKIASVLTDLFGVSAQNMLLALLEGVATPDEIAQSARGTAQRKIAQLIDALEGHRFLQLYLPGNQLRITPYPFTFRRFGVVSLCLV